MTGRPPPIHKIVQAPNFLSGVEDVFEYLISESYREGVLSAVLRGKGIPQHEQDALKTVCLITFEKLQEALANNTGVEGAANKLAEAGIPIQHIPKLLSEVVDALSVKQASAALEGSKAGLVMEGHLDAFDTGKQDCFLGELSEAICLPRAAIAIAKLRSGSVIVELEFDSDHALTTFINSHLESRGPLRRFYKKWKVKDVTFSERPKGTLEMRDAEEKQDAHEANKPAHPRLIFISYSHKDRKWLLELQEALSPLARNGKLALWSDQDLGVGDDWKKDISSALEQAYAAVLLVSPAFVASPFIQSQELPKLLTNSLLGITRIMWIPLRSALVEEVGLDKFQAVCSPNKPIASLPKHKRDSVWTDVARKIGAYASWKSVSET